MTSFSAAWGDGTSVSESPATPAAWSRTMMARMAVTSLVRVLQAAHCTIAAYPSRPTLKRGGGCQSGNSVHGSPGRVLPGAAGSGESIFRRWSRGAQALDGLDGQHAQVTDLKSSGLQGGWVWRVPGMRDSDSAQRGGHRGPDPVRRVLHRRA